MSSIYDDIFKYTDIFNPVSLQTLLSAGKLANLGPEKTLIDLGSGKGFPSLFLCSIFGVQVEGSISEKLTLNTQIHVLNSLTYPVAPDISAKTLKGLFQTRIRYCSFLGYRA
jgi:hypothetical protein